MPAALLSKRGRHGRFPPYPVGCASWARKPVDPRSSESRCSGDLSTGPQPAPGRSLAVLAGAGSDRGPRESVRSRGTSAPGRTALENRRRIDWALRQLEPHRSDRILEIGFGPGVSIQRLASRIDRGFVAGLELSPLMVAQARRRLAGAIAAGRVELRQGTVSSMPYDDDSFDRALAINTTMFWPHPEEDLVEVKRVLAPGGKLLIVLQPHGARNEAALHRVSAKIEMQMAAAGFTDMTTQLQPMRPVTCIAVHAVKPRTDFDGLQPRIC